jgi:hypothetical protein
MGPLAWLALAGVNAAMGSAKASQAAKQRKAEAEMRAAEIEASPWTGKAASTQVSTPSPNIWGELAGAGVNTLGQAAALQGSGLFSEGASTPPGLGAQNPLMQTSTGNAPTLFGRTPSSSMWNLGQYKF